MILPFLSQNLRMTGKSLQFKSSPYEKAEEFNDFQSYYFPSNLKKKKIIKIKNNNIKKKKKK